MTEVGQFSLRNVIHIIHDMKLFLHLVFPWTMLIISRDGNHKCLTICGGSVAGSDDDGGDQVSQTYTSLENT